MCLFLTEHTHISIDILYRDVYSFNRQNYCSVYCIANTPWVSVGMPNAGGPNAKLLVATFFR